MPAKPQDHNRAERRVRRFNRDALIRLLEEKTGHESEIVFETNDGTEFIFPSPEFFDDDRIQAMSEVADDDFRGAARVALGDQYDEFIEHGGQAMDIARLFRLLQDEQETDVTPEGRPTAR